MGNALEFLLRLTDKLTPGMRQAAQISNTSAAQISAQFERIGSGGRRMSASVDELRSRLESINRVRFSTTVEREFNVASRAARQLEGQISRLENRGQSKGLGMLSGLLAGVGVFSGMKNALSSAAEREQQQISFRVMTGSPATGDKMLNDLVKMGADTPFESADLIKAAQTMKQFGIANEAVLPNLRMLGDVAGGNAEKLQSLALAYSQVQSTGRLQGQDLLQLINAGFNPLLEISKATGVSMADLKKRMEEGSISADMVTKAFQRATGPSGQFHDMMKLQSQTLAGRWSTFMDNAKAKLLNLGVALMPVASKLLDFGSAMLSGEPWALALAGGIGLLTLAINWNNIAQWAFKAAASTSAFFTGIWTAAQWALNAAFWANPITWIVMGIIALIAVIGYVIYTTDGWGKQWDSIVKFLKYSWAQFVDMFKIMWLDSVDSFHLGIELIEKAWYKLKSLWDKEGAQKELAKINDNQNARAQEILELRKKWMGERQMASDSLKWELHSNGKGLGTIIPDIKKKLGLGGGSASPGAGGSAADAAGTGDDMSFGDLTKGKSKSINGGGQRSITINITKVIENLTFHTLNMKESREELEAIVKEAIRRSFLSINNMTTT